MIREIGFWLALLSLLTRRDRTAIETEEKEESLRYPPPLFPECVRAEMEKILGGVKGKGGRRTFLSSLS